MKSPVTHCITGLILLYIYRKSLRIDHGIYGFGALLSIIKETLAFCLDFSSKHFLHWQLCCHLGFMQTNYN